MGYSHKRISIELVLNDDSNDYFTNGTRGLRIEECKCIARLRTSGAVGGESLDLQIWGMSLDNISKFMIVANEQERIGRNIIRVFANDNLFYEGPILQTQLNMNDAPDISVDIYSLSTTLAQLTTSPPQHFKSGTSFVEAMGVIASKVGMSVNNYAEDFTIGDTTLEGNPVNQMQQLVDAYNTRGIYLNMSMHTVTILEYGKPRDDAAIAISPRNGLIGYPQTAQWGVVMTTMYSPELQNGRVISLETAVPNLSGNYQIATCTHEISAWINDGPWYSHLVTYYRIDE